MTAIQNVLNFSRQVGFVGAEVQQSVPGKIKQYHPFPSFLARPFRFQHHRRYGVRGFRRGNNPFRARKKRPGFKHAGLVNRQRLDQPQFERMADGRRHSVEAQSAGVDRRGHELVPERVHHQERRGLRRIAKIVAQLTLGQRRTGRGFHGDNSVFIPVLDFSLQKWECQPRKIAATPCAAKDEIGILARHFHLPDGFLADDGLMQANVVEHAAQGILGVRMGHSVLDRFADGDPKASGTMRVFGKQLAAKLRLVAGAGVNRRAPSVHEHPAIRLLLVTDLDHIDIALQPKQLAGQGKGRPPLARARFRCEPFGAGLLVEKGLWNRSIDLVAASGAGAFVFVVNMGRGLERALKTHRSQQWGWTPQRINLAHRFRDFDPTVRTHFLPHEVFRKKPGHQLGRHWLARARMQRRRKGFREMAGRLYHCFGISACDKMNRVVWLMGSWAGIWLFDDSGHFHSQKRVETVTLQTSRILPTP